jgi:pimeloyl-ACP methyl ester carboxylesterase
MHDLTESPRRGVKPLSTPSIRLDSIRKPPRKLAAVDVIFVHGLGGDYLSTWHPEKDPKAYFPSWISQDLKLTRAFSLDYPAAATKWTSDSSEMGILERSKNILEYLSVSGVGERPIVFVAHSLGGLLVKQLLYTADSLNVTKWLPLLKNTRGVVFLATPHTGSSLSQLASALSLLSKPTQITGDLERGSEYLQQLSHWFAQNAGRLDIKVEAYHETVKFAGGPVVDRVSANPGVFGCVPVGVDGDHFTICKPSNRDELVYRGVHKFIDEIISTLLRRPHPNRVYFVPGYTKSFRALREAILSTSGWPFCDIIEEDTYRLLYAMSRRQMESGRCVMIIDFVFSDSNRHDTEHVLDLIRLTRSLGRALPFKPIFVFFSKQDELVQLFERLGSSEKEALERYIRLEPWEAGEDASERLQILYSRVDTEWKERPQSSNSLL